MPIDVKSTLTVWPVPFWNCARSSSAVVCKAPAQRNLNSAARTATALPASDDTTIAHIAIDLGRLMVPLSLAAGERMRLKRLKATSSAYLVRVNSGRTQTEHNTSGLLPRAD